METGRAEAARWRRRFVAAALLTLPVLISSMLLPMAWPAAAAWLSGHTVSFAGPTVANALVGTDCSCGHASAALPPLIRLASFVSVIFLDHLQVAGFPADQLLRLGFTTPVQFWLGWRFHRGAYQALRAGRCARMAIWLGCGCWELRAGSCSCSRS